VIVAKKHLFEILGFKRIAVTTLPFTVTWRHRSRDHSIPHRPFPIRGPLEPSFYLQRFPRYSMANATQWLTWPHTTSIQRLRSFWYQSIPHIWLPIGCQK